MKRKARNYWKHFGNLAGALEPAVGRLGYLPSQRELRSMGLSSLNRSMRHFGGHTPVARRLKIPTAPEHRRTHLRKWEYFTREILPLVAARGYFPTVSELTREGRYDLIAALRRYHGGVRKAARKLGVLTYCTRHGHKSSGFWTEERIIAAYRDVIRTQACTHWPSPNDLTRLGYGDLRGAMQKLGYRKVREHLTKEGIALDTKPRKLDYLIPFSQQYPLCNEIFTKGELFFYFLGLVAADGAFVSTRHEESVELCLKKGDREILETLRKRISPSRPIHRKPNRKNPAHEAVRFKLNDRRIISLLKEYMPTQDKSRRLTWPEGIPDEHLHHFIRGYVDGDGTLGITLNRQSVRGTVRFYPVTRLRVLGTEDFLTGLTRAIQQMYTITPVKVSRKGKENVFELQYSGSHAEKILTWLYRGATIYLRRKREVYDYLLGTDRETLLANYGTPAGRYNLRASRSQLITMKKSG